MSGYLAKDAEVTLEAASSARVCLSWDLFPGSVQTDLDCAALAFDSSTTLIDACFYNNVSSLNGSVKHSGDEQDGKKEGFDEVITLDLPNVPPHVSVLCFVVNAYQGGTLADVETAYATVQQEGKGELARLSLCCGKNVAATATICVLVYRKAGAWCLRNVQSEAAGRTFSDAYPSVLKSLEAVVDPVLMGERRASMDKTFKMSKSDVMEIPPDLFTSGEDLFVGLGWNTNCDLDAAVILTDNDLPPSETPRPEAEMGHALNIVNFKDRTFGRAVKHGGDNRTGAGDGDDERIDIDLDCMPEAVKSFWVVVNIYTNGPSFSDVRGAYIRLVAAKNNHELCRFTLEDGSVSERGLVLAKVSRNAVGRWCVRSIGKGCDGDTANAPGTMRACEVRAMAPAARIQQVETQASPAVTWTLATLKVRGLKLAAKDSFLMGGKSDPYFEVWEAPAAGTPPSHAQDPSVMSPNGHRVICRSQTLMKTLDPEWQEVRFEVKPGCLMRVVVWDYDKMSAPDLIGFHHVGAMTTVTDNPFQAGQYPLTPPPPPHKQDAGTIEIVLSKVEEQTTRHLADLARMRRSLESAAWISSSDPGPTIPRTL